MKKNVGAKLALYPMPVTLASQFEEGGTALKGDNACDV